MTDKPNEITAEMFLAATGREPQDDDLERSNCHLRGVTHFHCGWNLAANKPCFEVPFKMPGSIA